VTVEQILQKEIHESKKWLDRGNEDSTYKRDLQKRIELINWLLDNIRIRIFLFVTILNLE
jgi:hypothetical protein